MTQSASERTVEVVFRSPYSTHGEEIVRSRIGPLHSGVSRTPLVWPPPTATVESSRDDQTLVARVEGVVAGRAVLGAERYPFAELENLEVLPYFRGQGVASHLVASAVQRAAEMGFLAIHLQTFLDNVEAHRLYSRHGFLPATQGEMLRMIRFLNYPALSHFLWKHPLAVFHSLSGEASGKPPWRLSWTDPISDASLEIDLSGGSCQFDSNEFGPGVSKVRIRSDDACFEATVSGPRESPRGRPFDLEVGFANSGSTKVEAGCRLLLNAGFAPAPGTQGAATFALEPGDSEARVLSAEITESFDQDLWKICSYPSVPVGVEFFVGDYVFWLAHQVKPGTRREAATMNGRAKEVL